MLKTASTIIMCHIMVVILTISL